MIIDICASWIPSISKGWEGTDAVCITLIRITQYTHTLSPPFYFYSQPTTFSIARVQGKIHTETGGRLFAAQSFTRISDLSGEEIPIPIPRYKVNRLKKTGKR